MAWYDLVYRVFNKKYRSMENNNFNNNNFNQNNPGDTGNNNPSNCQNESYEFYETMINPDLHGGGALEI